jgi:FkbM family methyltransferase
MPNAAIFAVEANPDTFQVLFKNVKLNALDRSIRPFNLAMSSRTGKQPFFCAETSGWSSLYDLRGAKDGRAVSVDTMNLSSFRKFHGIREIDYLKIDIEGAEYDVVLGDPEFFAAPIHHLVMELDREPRDRRYTFDELLNCLKRHYGSVSVTCPGWQEYPLVHCKKPRGCRAAA